MLIHSHRKLSKDDTVAAKTSVNQGWDGPIWRQWHRGFVPPCGPVTDCSLLPVRDITESSRKRVAVQHRVLYTG